jgi:hypothetical protein
MKDNDNLNSLYSNSFLLQILGGIKADKVKIHSQSQVTHQCRLNAHEIPAHAVIKPLL